jgi:hypothetical protein
MQTETSSHIIKSDEEEGQSEEEEQSDGEEYAEEDEEDEFDEDEDYLEEDDENDDSSVDTRPNRRQDLPDQKLSVNLIATRGIDPKAMSKMSATEIADAVLDLKHVRLDDERIAEIDNMEALGPNVTHLYLQRNRITKIENLESLQRLQVSNPAFRLNAKVGTHFVEIRGSFCASHQTAS